MHFDSQKNSLTLLKREKEHLAAAWPILRDAGRIIGNPVVQEASEWVKKALVELGLAMSVATDSEVQEIQKSFLEPDHGCDPAGKEGAK